MPNLIHPVARLWRLALALSVGICTAAHAELPDEAYLNDQKHAPEWLEIEVISTTAKVSKTEKRDDATLVYIQATMQVRVTKVHHSATHLRAGAVITLDYEVMKMPPMWSGPRETPILLPPAQTTAYLQFDAKGENAYTPAAGGYTFKTFDPRHRYD